MELITSRASQVYSVNGVVLPQYPTSVQASDNLVSKSWNDMNGVFHDIPVNLKTKINWIFDPISTDALNQIYGNVIRKQIITPGEDGKYSRFFTITSYFPGVGFVSGIYYLGTPTTFNNVDWMTGNGQSNYWKVEFHWIEVTGTILNSPTSVASTTQILLNGKKTNMLDLDKVV